MRGALVIAFGLLSSCISTLALQPVHLAKAGEYAISGDLTVRAVDDRLPMPFPLPTVSVATGLDPATDVTIRIGVMGVGGTLRRLATAPDAPGPALLLQAGATAGVIPDYSWANGFVGPRLGVPFGPGSTRHTSHLILDLRLEGHGVSAFCTGPCGGVSLGLGFSTGVAWRVVPGAWIVFETGLHRPLTDFGSGRWIESVGLAGAIPATVVVDAGMAVRFDGDFSPRR